MPHPIEPSTLRNLSSHHPLVEGIHLLPFDYALRIENFLAEYLGTEQEPEAFGGRLEAIRALNDWLAGAASRLLLAAPAGRGKSALLAHWVKNLLPRNDLAVVFVPVSVRFRTNLASLVFAALATRLAFLHHEAVPADLETSTDTWKNLVNSYLRKPLPNGKTLLVVIDGLDEAGDWEAGENTLPRELPPGVRIVVSARFLAGDQDAQPWLTRLGWDQAAVPSLELTPLTLAGVGEILRQMNFPVAEFSQQVDIVSELYRQSEGDPLLVHLYIEDLWANKGTELRLRPSDLARLEPGYEGYFHYWWQNQEKRRKDLGLETQENLQSLLNLLTGALGPLTLAEITTLVPELTADEIEVGLALIQRLIVREARTQGYTFRHRKLRGVFWEQLAEAEQKRLETRFLQWGENTLQQLLAGQLQPGQTPYYLVQYYGAHLERANAPVEKFLPLIEKPAWQQACFVAEGAYPGYLRDVKRVWKACVAIDRHQIEQGQKAHLLGKEIRCALIEASLYSISRNVTPDFLAQLFEAGIWGWSQTLKHLRAKLPQDQRAAALKSLIPLLPEPALPEVLSLVQNLENEWFRAILLADLAPRLPAEWFGKAVKIAEGIDFDWARNHALNILAQHEPNENRNLAPGPLAPLGPEQKLINSFAAQITPNLNLQRETGDTGRNLLLQLLPILPQELRSDFLQVARKIQYPSERADTLLKLVDYFTGEERRRIWLEIFESLQKTAADGVTGFIVARCAEHFHSHEDWLWEKIFPLLRQEKNSQNRAYMLKVVINHLPGHLWKQYFASFEGLNSYEKNDVYIEILPKVPDIFINEILIEIENSVGERNCPLALARLIGRLPDKKRPEIIEKIIEAVKQIKSEYLFFYYNALHILAAELPTELAIQLLPFTQALDPDNANTLLANIARKAPAEKLQVLLKLLQIDKLTWGGFELLSIAAHRGPDEILNEVLEKARKLPYAGHRASVLVILAQRFPKKQRRAMWDEAIQAINEATNQAKTAEQACVRADHLIRISGCLPTPQKLEILEEALSIIRTITQEGVKLSRLRELIAASPDELIGKLVPVALELELPDIVYEASEIMITLAKRLSGKEKELILEKALVLARRNDRNTTSLSIIASLLPDGELKQVVLREACISFCCQFFASDIRGMRQELLSQISALPLAGQFETWQQIMTDLWPRKRADFF